MPSERVRPPSVTVQFPDIYFGYGASQIIERRFYDSGNGGYPIYQYDAENTELYREYTKFMANMWAKAAMQAEGML